MNNPPMVIDKDTLAILRNFKKCCHKNCVGRGIWVPVLVIPLIDQQDGEKPVKILIPIKLCEYHKATCQAGDVLTAQSWRAVDIKVRGIRDGRGINRDGLTMEWIDKGIKELGPSLADAWADLQRFNKRHGK